MRISVSSDETTMAFTGGLERVWRAEDDGCRLPLAQIVALPLLGYFV